MGMLAFLGRILLDILVVTLILFFLPGIPPYVDFEAFSLLPPPAFEGPLAPNERLNDAERLYEGAIKGPESLVSYQGELYTGLVGGHIIKLDENLKIRPVAKIGKDCDGPWQELICGRPLGMRFDKDGTLLVVDAALGLHRIEVTTGKVIPLSPTSVLINNSHPYCPNDLDVTSDGTIYWSSSSSHFHRFETMLEILSGPSGRLLKYDPVTNTSEVLIQKLHYPSGVQLSPDEDFLLVTEVARCRIIRYYLKGEKKGTYDIFVDNIPGAPDNIRSNDHGGYYVAMNVVRLPSRFSLLDLLQPHPLLRRFILRLITLLMLPVRAINSILPNQYSEMLIFQVGNPELIATRLTPPYGLVVELDANGNIISSMHSTNAAVSFMSEVAVHNGYFYFGSPYNEYLGRVKMRPSLSVITTEGDAHVA